MLAQLTRSKICNCEAWLEPMKIYEKPSIRLHSCCPAVLLTQLGAQSPQQNSHSSAPEQNQQTPVQPNKQGKILLSQPVVVPVTVRTDPEELVPDLRRDEFRISKTHSKENRYFGADPMPIP